MTIWIKGFEGKYSVDKYEGLIYRHFKNSKRALTGGIVNKLHLVKLTDFDGNAKRYNYGKLVYETLYHPIPDGYVIGRKNGIRTDHRPVNMRLITLKESGRLTGGKSKSKPVELLDDTGEVVDSWSSARRAAKALFISYQTVANICNGVTKDKVYNLRWEKG